MRFLAVISRQITTMIRQLIYKAFSHLGSSEIRALERDTLDPEGAQRRKLKDILQRNARTKYGIDRDFAHIDDPETYRHRVPINDYDSLSPWINRMLCGEQNVLTAREPFMYATTSGTTGSQKFIPVNEDYIKEFRHASVASGYFTLQHHPRIDRGVTLTVFSPAVEGTTAGGTPFGAISGGLYLREPSLVKKFIAPIPYSIYLIRDYESKYYALLRVALMLPITCFYTLNPSTITILVRRLHKYAPQLIADIERGSISTPTALDAETLKELAPFIRPDRKRAEQLQRLLDTGAFQPYRLWPDLQVVCCWTKAAAAFYLSDFNEFFAQTPVCDISYGASEGRGSISLGDGRQLLSLRSHFFEFIPEDEIDLAEPTVLLAHELEVGRNYYILFTTSAGLYRYHINDVIRVTGKYNRTPLIEFQYKGGNVCSFTGEKLTELHVTNAMSATLSQLGLRCRYFTLLPEFRPLPHYRLLFEAEESTAAETLHNRLAETFDSALCRANIEYAAKRESQRLAPIELAMVRTGTYDALRRKVSASGVADAQFKPSHLNPKDDIREFFEQNVVESKFSASPIDAPCSAS